MRGRLYISLLELIRSAAIKMTIKPTCNKRRGNFQKKLNYKFL